MFSQIEFLKEEIREKNMLLRSLAERNPSASTSSNPASNTKHDDKIVHTMNKSSDERKQLQEIRSRKHAEYISFTRNDAHWNTNPLTCKPVKPVKPVKPAKPVNHTEVSPTPTDNFETRIRKACWLRRGK